MVLRCNFTPVFTKPILYIMNKSIWGICLVLWLSLLAQACTSSVAPKPSPLLGHWVFESGKLNGDEEHARQSFKGFKLEFMRFDSTETEKIKTYQGLLASNLFKEIATLQNTKIPDTLAFVLEKEALVLENNPIQLKLLKPVDSLSLSLGFTVEQGGVAYDFEMNFVRKND
jgi:hypothetical protein